jgi:hypothetical protein
MEAVMQEPTTSNDGGDITVTAEPPAPSDATKPPRELFRYSAYVHVGPGAEECEHRDDGACSNPEHFHAWCRLPNQFQHQDIRQRALAAKARRIRQLRDPEADSCVILEADLEEIARTGDQETVVDEIVGKDWWKRQLEAMRDVEEREEFEHIERDRERLGEIDRMPEDKRPAEERDEIERHLTAYGEAVDARRKELEDPVRAALADKSMDELVQMIRDDRVTAEASSAFMGTYSKWEWFAGTMVCGQRDVRVFASIDALENAAPEVVEALRTTYAELEVSLQRGPKGNS